MEVVVLPIGKISTYYVEQGGFNNGRCIIYSSYMVNY